MEYMAVKRFVLETLGFHADQCAEVIVQHQDSSSSWFVEVVRWLRVSFCAKV
jgi:hypothetical protein